jgi:hypothetical protein
MTVLGLVDEETHREVFQDIADKFKDGMVFVETGVFLGSDIVTFALRCKHRKVYPDIWAVDNFLSENISEASKNYVGVHDHFREAFERNLQASGVDHLVTIVQEDSIEAADTFMDESIDFLFLDSCHEYTFVKLELEKWLPKMKKNSILAGHDYPSDGIKRAVAEVLGEVTTTSNGASYIKVIGKGL